MQSLELLFSMTLDGPPQKAGIISQVDDRDVIRGQRGAQELAPDTCEACRTVGRKEPQTALPSLVIEQ